MLRKFIIVFCAINLLIVSATVFVRCSKTARRNLASTVFSINRNPRVVSADVLGYTFEINRHRNSPSTTSYFYAVAYRFGDENYFAVVKIADSVNFGDNEHLPLPKRIEIKIDGNDPKIVFYPERRASISAGFWLVQIFFVALFTLLLFASNTISGKSEREEWNKSKGFSEKIKYLAVRLMLLIPLLFFVSEIKSVVYLSAADDITNYRLLLVNEALEKKIIELNQNLSNPEQIEYTKGNINSYLRDFRALAIIENFQDDLAECYGITASGEKIPLEYKFNGRQLYIVDQSKPGEVKNVFLKTERLTYILPIERILTEN